MGDALRLPRLGLAALILPIACGSGRPKPVAPRVDPTAVTSNVLRSDYVGSRACETCHADIYQAWLGSPMHRMTRLPEEAEIRAPFDGSSFRFKDDVVKLERRGRQRFVSISSRAFGDHVYIVTKVIGGRYREDFAGVEVKAGVEEVKAGVEVKAAEPGLFIIGDGRSELVLPFTYVYSPPSFRLKGYSVMVGERPGLKAGGAWNQTCIFCHNTVPTFSTLMGELYGVHAPTYQGATIDRLLPGSRRATLHIRDAAGLESAAADEVAFLLQGDAKATRLGDGSGTQVAEVLAGAIRTTRERFGATSLVEVGIGCESCHGGSREHVARPSRKPSFAAQSPFFEVQASAWDEMHHAPDRARAINRACARCHQVLFSRYPFTWEGGGRMDNPGGSHISSGEARDFLLGGCSSALTCTTCHDPHAADPKERLDALATPAGNEICTKCHAAYRSGAALRAHAHHDPNGLGAACIGCHMPQKNMGLGYNLTRYHRIGSPTEKNRVEKDRPLECALCHVDKTAGELVSAMERFWNKSFDRSRLVALYGDLSAPVLESTVLTGKAHEQATAIHVLGEHKVKRALPLVAAQLLNRYPLVRYFARQALEQMTERACDVDLDQEDAKIASDAERWLESAGSHWPEGGPSRTSVSSTPSEDATED